MKDNGRDVLIAGVVVFVASLGALVFLQAKGLGTAELIALAGPVVAALLVTGHVSRVTGEQNQQIERIERQTNGVLDERIKRQTIAALVESGVIAAPGSLPAPKLDNPPTEGD